MTIKVTAITASVFAVLLFVLATIFPNDIYFYIISSNLAIGIGRILLSLILVYVAFKHGFRSVIGNMLCAMAAVVFTAFGAVAIMDVSVMHSLLKWIKPLDYVYMIEAGVIFGLAAVSYKYQEKRMPQLPRLSRPRVGQLRLFSTQLASMFGVEISQQRSQSFSSK